jgi:hypothetical protein
LADESSAMQPPHPSLATSHLAAGRYVSGAARREDRVVVTLPPGGASPLGVGTVSVNLSPSRAY